MLARLTLGETAMTSKAGNGRDSAKSKRLEVKYPRRTERRKRTRAAIEQAALQLFSETGYRATTMQAIADEADVHVTTLFTHFRTKADLALTLVNSLTDQLRERAFKARGQQDVFDFFRDEADRFLKMVVTQSGKQNGLLSALRQDEEFSFVWTKFEDEQTAILADFIAHDYGLDPEAGPSPRLAAFLMLGSLFLPHARWLESGESSPLRQDVMSAVATAERGARAMLDHTSRNK